MSNQAQLNNEVYSTMKLVFSTKVDSNNRELANVEAGYQLHPQRFVSVEVMLTDTMGNIRTVEVHDWDIELENYFNEING
jgi:hypothetical protein